MENIISPTINKIEQDNKDVLKETMDLLVKKFNLELKRGNIAIKSVNDFTRLATLMLQMQGEITPMAESFIMPNLSKTDEEMMEDLYENLVKTLNDTHDLENRG
ncbi:MAG: hypothetical protein E7F47_05910 [Peptoniphilus harei]|nr:hypothetical protein [Peptoniphilus harei]